MGHSVKQQKLDAYNGDIVVLSLGNTLDANIHTSGGAAERIKAKVEKRKIVNSRFGNASLSPWETSRNCPTGPEHFTRRGGAA